MLTRRRPVPYNIDDPNTLETKQQHQLQPSQPSVSNQKSVDLPSMFNPKVITELDSCILKMINVDPNKRHNSVWGFNNRSRHDEILDMMILPVSNTQFIIS